MTDENPTLRTPGPDYGPKAPSSFVNTGGVLRAQVGNAEDAQALQQYAERNRQVDLREPQWTSSARTTGDLISTTTLNGVSIDTVKNSLNSATAGETESASGKFGVVASARSSGGRPLSGNEITKASLCTVDGVTTSIGAALALGLIRVDGRTGLYVEMSSTGAAILPQTPQEARASQLTRDQAELQRQLDAREAEQEKAESTEVPVAEPFADASHEALLADTISGLGNQISQAALHSVINTGALSDSLTTTIAGQLGIEGEQATERATVLMGAFTAQANAAIGHGTGDGAEAIWAWARENRAGDLKEAMIRHANEGTTSRYGKIASDYFSSLADTQQGRDMILASKDAARLKISVDPRSNRLFITDPKAGKVEWRVACKTGLIKPNRKA